MLIVSFPIQSYNVFRFCQNFGICLKLQNEIISTPMEDSLQSFLSVKPRRNEEMLSNLHFYLKFEQLQNFVNI